MEKNEDKRGNILALTPLAVFLVIYIGAGVIFHDFYKMPTLVAFFIAAVIAVAMNFKKSVNEKMDVFCRGAGEANIILMCFIFLMAGAFAQVARDMGGVETTVNLALSFLPGNLLLPGLFLVGCFISISMGTSMGTIVALAPIGVGIADQTGISVALATAAVVGGAMFGDNLSMISDTTIAAVRTQGCRMKDKFLMNFLIVLPAALISGVLLFFAARGIAVVPESHSYTVLKVIPYIFVLGAALLGVNVMIVLLGGIVIGGGIGLSMGAFSLLELFQSIGKGMLGMASLALIALFVGGMVAMIEYNGGIDFVMHRIGRNIRSRRGAELGIAGLVSLVDVCTAYNTIAIVITGPLSRDISRKYGISPRRAASLMDIFSCCFQGLIPYGAQLLAAAGIAGISPVAILPYNYYPILLGISGLLAIFFGIPGERSAVDTSAEPASSGGSL